MAKIPPFEDEYERIDREAAEWLARASQGLSPEERQTYDQWLKSDVRHAKRTEAHQETRSSLRALSSLIPPDSSDPDPDLFAPLSTERRWPAWVAPATITALAASIAFAALLSFIPGTPFSRTEEHQRNSFVAAAGFESHFLDDGTLVSLKDGAEIDVHFTARQRDVRLVRGEAHFSVTQDPSRPFVVHARQASFRAIGTAFNVRLSSSEVELMVTEGVVQIDDSAPIESRKGLAASQTAMRNLEANQKATISFDDSRSYPRIENIDTAEVDRKLQWKHETLAFEATRLADAIRLFNARNRDQIVIEDPMLGEERIDGSFRSDNLAGFIKVLEISAGIESEHAGHSRILIRRKSI